MIQIPLKHFLVNLVKYRFSTVTLYFIVATKMSFMKQFWKTKRSIILKSVECNKRIQNDVFR